MTWKIQLLSSADNEGIQWTNRVHMDAPIEWNPAHKSCPEVSAGSERSLRRGLESGATAVFLAIDSAGARIGLHWVNLEIEHQQFRAHISSLWVHPERRRLGIARALKAAGEAWARDRGARTMQTYVYLTNEKMLRLNQSLGFKPGKVELFKDL